MNTFNSRTNQITGQCSTIKLMLITLTYWGFLFSAYNNMPFRPSWAENERDETGRRTHVPLDPGHRLADRRLFAVREAASSRPAISAAICL